MQPLPLFTAERLTLRQRTFDDLPACLAMDRDPEVTRFIPGPWTDPVLHEALVRQRIETGYGDGLGYWSVFSHERPDRFLGWILLIPLEGSTPEVEIGWRFNRHAWGQGYATEAAATVLDHGLATLELGHVVANIDPDNAASIRVAQKIGLIDEGLREHNGTQWHAFAIRRPTSANAT